MFQYGKFCRHAHGSVSWWQAANECDTQPIEYSGNIHNLFGDKTSPEF